MSNSPVYVGRHKIFTQLEETDFTGPEAAELIKNDLEQWVLPVHHENASEIEYLENYYLGWHPEIINRVKETRGEINNKIRLNYAKSFTRDIVSYFLGKPVEYLHREDKWRDAIDKLSNALDAENKNLVDYDIATNMSICGVGYRGIFTEKEPTNGTHLKVMSLDPKSTFVVYSPDPQVGALYCGTFYTTVPTILNKETKTVYTIYTKSKIYKFESPGTGGVLSMSGLQLVSEEDASLGGNLPIVMYQNTKHMVGDWESELAIMDALDKLTSDSLNDIEQFVNAILLMQGFEVDEEMLTSLKDNKVLNISDVPQGVEVLVKYIVEQLDPNNVESLRDWLESTMRVIVGVPDRKTRGGGGGDTGDAVFLRDGWQDIDLVASVKESFFIDADRKSLATMLYIMQTFNEIDKGVQVQDVQIKFSRSKQANLQAKAQAYSTMVGAVAPIAPEDALEFADLTNNVSDVIMRSKAYEEEKLKKTAEAQQLYMNNQPSQATGSNSGQNSNNEQNKKPKESNSSTGEQVKGSTN